MATTHKVRVKIRAFPYYTPGVDPVSGREIRTEHVGVRGEEVTLEEDDFQRALKFDAIEAIEEEAPAEPDAAIPVADNIDAATVEEVANWLKTSKPTVDETVAAAEDDAMKAKKLLDAENLATGRQPRVGVVNGLEAIIKGDGEEPPAA